MYPSFTQLKKCFGGNMVIQTQPLPMWNLQTSGEKTACNYAHKST